MLCPVTFCDHEYPAQYCVRSSYLPHSFMVDSGKESEVGMMSEQVESHARKRAMSMVSALSIRQGSPTKKIHHGL